MLGVLLGSSAAFANSNASNDTGRSSKTAGQTCNSSCHSPTGNDVTGGSAADMGSAADGGVAPVDDMATSPVGNGGSGGSAGSGGGTGDSSGTPTPSPMPASPDMASTPIGGLPGCEMAPRHRRGSSGVGLALALVALGLLRRRRTAA